MNNKENIFQNKHNSDWKYLPMNILGETFGGLSGKTKDNFNNGNKKYISYKRIFQNALMTSNDFERVSISKDEKQNTVIYGDCLFTTSSETPDEVAMSSVFLIDSSEEFYLNSFSFGYRFNDLTDINPKFYGYYFRGPQFRKETYKFAQGSTRYNISKNKLTEVSIPIPPLNEQQKIAEILSTIDEQIDQTSQLIEKTKELKKGLMQQLLTKGIGHTDFKQSELGGIPLNWNVEELDRMGVWYGGGTPSKRNPKNWSNKKEIFWITSKDMHTNKIQESELSITKLGLLEKNLKLLPINTLIFVMRSGILRNYVPVAITNVPVTINQDQKALVCNKGICAQFILYTIQNYNQFIKNTYVKTGTTVESIDFSGFKQYKIALPPLEEQKKIAAILLSVDEDIEGYEQEKAKYEELKKGLMQQLLTGNKRVKVD